MYIDKSKIKFFLSDNYVQKKLTKRTAIINPKSPIALPKISTIKILTNNVESAASANAAPDPTWPTQRPHTRFTRPVVRPAANIAYPEK